MMMNLILKSASRRAETRRAALLVAAACALFAAQGCEQQASDAVAPAAQNVADPAKADESCHTTPNRETLAAGSAAAAPSEAAPSASGKRRFDADGMVLIPGGTFLMGTNDGMPYEAPAHEVTLKPFLIDRHEVTVAEFAGFVKATGYVTEAERYGSSGVFDTESGAWSMIAEANWRQPEGEGSKAAPDEPVCQVSWNDASEYAKWAGKRLPTEAEFERAARGGLRGKTYAWGDELRPGGKPVANWWQGEFPVHNTGEDGFRRRAPVGSFEPNGYGLYDVAGNVWEWCADWYADDYYSRGVRDNPTGAGAGSERVMRGGSWMCAENFCTNYRVAGRSHSTPDTGLNNVGFRCARDADAAIASND